MAYNHVYDCDKEGIDVKEVSAHGTVHHDHVHDVVRQGLYADAWFGALEDVEFGDNVVHNWQGAGLAFSVEGGEALSDVRACPGRGRDAAAGLRPAVPAAHAR